ncbi:MAG: Uma2 family endonuclease [Oscillochloris sp.]|nr:Uma2 family endonuclease [Oscillochloris sp.]
MKLISSRLTVDDLEGLPEGDGNRYELIEGALHVTTQPHLHHQIVSDAVCEALRIWNRRNKLGGLAVSAPGIILAPDEAFAPDVVWYGSERLAAHLRADGKFYGPPDLAVEVLSPGAKNIKRDRQLKRARYAYWGIREYWLVDREARRMEVYRLQGDAYLAGPPLSAADQLESPILPGFSCSVGDFFVDLPVGQ